MTSRSFVRTLTVLALATLIPLTARAATVTVTSNGDTLAVDGLVTLREALASINAGANVNADVGASGYGTNDTVLFSIPGGGVRTITLGANLPAISQTVVIDGYSQPGSSVNTLAVGNDAVVNIELAGTLAINQALSFSGGLNSKVRGLTIRGFFFGINIATAHLSIEGCFIGTDPSGVAGANQVGINVSNGATVGANTIGGANPDQRNVISGNSGSGIIMNNGSGFPNPVLGNYIGVDPQGTAVLANGGYGIAIGSVGGPPIDGPTIGGPTTTAGQGAGNVISGNGLGGILIQALGGSTVIGAGTIEGNIIGLNATGTAAVANASFGIAIEDSDLGSGSPPALGPITVGGVGAGNVISGNTGGGIRAIAAGTIIRGNYIGTDITGTLQRANANGITIDGVGAFEASATIGGSVAGNTGNAVNVRLATVTVQGNRIGVGAGGQALGNSGFGVEVNSALADIGGTGAGEDNVIANNGDTGVDVRIGVGAIRPASDAAILGNAIRNNGLAQPPAGRFGINLFAPDLVTPNDPGDGDTGPSDLQNYPLLTNAVIAGSNLLVAGSLNSVPSGNYRVEIFSSTSCDATGFGEGGTYLGATNVATGPTGDVLFGPLSRPIPPGETFITATATNASNQTSEFSACLTATLATGSPAPASGELILGTNTVGDQSAPRIAALSDGAFIAVWHGPGVDGDGLGITARRFDREGNARGGEFAVNQTTAGDQSFPVVASNDAGDFAIAWEGDDANGRGIFMRMYDRSGNFLSAETAVNTTTLGSQLRPAVAIDENGNILVVWHGIGGPADPSGSAINGRRFTLGSPTSGGEIIINTTTGGDQTAADAVGLDLSGGFVVTWQGPDADGRGIFAQRLSALGAPVGGEIPVNGTTAGDQEAPAVAASGRNPDPGDLNRFVIAWQAPDADGRGIRLRRFAQADGTPIGGEEVVNQVPNGDQHDPRVTADDAPEGNVGVVATWLCSGVACLPGGRWRQAEAIAGAPILVRGRRVGGPGRSPATDEFTVNVSTSTHSHPGIAAGSDGDFVVAWQSSGQDGSGETVLGRRFYQSTIFRNAFENGTMGAWSAGFP
jgi:hypothetical protein